MILHESFYSSMAAAAAPENLRKEFLVSDLFREGETHLYYWGTDRTIIGGVVPTDAPLTLTTPTSMRASSFLERREAGVVNLGGPGRVVADGVEYTLGALDALYLGRGVRDFVFSSSDKAQPAHFYLLSYPAHTSYPVRRVGFNEVKGERLGTREACNERTLHKLIEPGTVSTCQLVMGVTCLQSGSVWNTMPPHTHLRRSEVYIYFNVPRDQVV